MLLIYHILFNINYFIFNLNLYLFLHLLSKDQNYTTSNLKTIHISQLMTFYIMNSILFQNISIQDPIHPFILSFLTIILLLSYYNTIFIHNIRLIQPLKTYLTFSIAKSNSLILITLFCYLLHALFKHHLLLMEKSFFLAYSNDFHFHIFFSPKHNI